MTDIVELLHREAWSTIDNGVGDGWLERGAAAEINRLREQVVELEQDADGYTRETTRLREALQLAENFVPTARLEEYLDAKRKALSDG